MMKKITLIFFLFFIINNSFGQSGNNKLELLRMNFIDVALSEQKLLLNNLKARKIRERDYYARFDELKLQADLTKRRLYKINSVNSDLSKLSSYTVVRFRNGVFEFAINNTWMNDRELFSYLMK